MDRSPRKLLFILGALAGLRNVQACYYQALDLENPSDYYYRYCYAGCTAIQAAQPDYTACCTPLPAGTSAPATCGQLSKSHEMAGTTCQWGAVPTTDFPQTYNYAPSTQPWGNKEKSTVWITSTTTTPCAQTHTSDYAPPVISSQAQPPAPSIVPDVSLVYTSTAIYVHEETSSGKLAQATSSSIVPPPPAPSSSPCDTSLTYVHQAPVSSAPPPPPVVSSKQAAWTSSAQPATSTAWEPPCIPSQQGLIYDTYIPCSGASCPHVGAAPPSGFVGDPQKRNGPLPSMACPHVGEAAPAGFSGEQQKRALLPTITPAPHVLRDGPRRPVIGYEPPQVNDKRALPMANMDNVKQPVPPLRNIHEEAKRGRTVTITSKLTGSQTFYDCAGTWVFGASSYMVSSTNAPSATSYGMSGGASGSGGLHQQSIYSGAGMAPSVMRKRELPVTVTVTSTLFPTASCPFPGGTIPGSAPTSSYISGTHPRGSKCYCKASYQQSSSASVPSGPASSATQSYSSTAGGLVMSVSGGVGEGAPSNIMISQDVVRRAVPTAVHEKALLTKREAMVECPCDCGQVISVSPIGTSTSAGGHSGGLAGFSINSGAGSVACLHLLNGPADKIRAAPNDSFQVDTARRALINLPCIPNIATDYLPVPGGFIKRDVPPNSWRRPEGPEKRKVNAIHNKREAPPETITSTKWITTDDCTPTSTMSAFHPHESHDGEDEECEEDWDSGDYSLHYDATSSGKLAQATSSPAPAGAPYSYQPGPSGAPHVGDGTRPPAFVVDAPEKRKDEGQ